MRETAAGDTQKSQRVKGKAHRGQWVFVEVTVRDDGQRPLGGHLRGPGPVHHALQPVPHEPVTTFKRPRKLLRDPDVEGERVMSGWHDLTVRHTGVWRQTEPH